MTPFFWQIQLDKQWLQKKSTQYSSSLHKSIKSRSSIQLKYVRDRTHFMCIFIFLNKYTPKIFYMFQFYDNHRKGWRLFLMNAPWLCWKVQCRQKDKTKINISLKFWESCFCRWREKSIVDRRLYQCNGSFT